MRFITRHTFVTYDNLHELIRYTSIYHECEDRIEKSVLRITVWHHEACRVMTNGDAEGQIFLKFNFGFSKMQVIIVTYTNMIGLILFPQGQSLKILRFPCF